MKQIKKCQGSYIAESAEVMGDVEIGEGTGIWYGSIVRGDWGEIKIGKFSNLQDGCIVHCDPGSDVIVGDYVTVGHGCIIHGCHIGNRSLIGMGSVILDGAVIGSDCIIAAGALVTGKTVVPDGTMYMGVPAKFKRCLTKQEKLYNVERANEYFVKAGEHFELG